MALFTRVGTRFAQSLAAAGLLLVSFAGDAANHPNIVFLLADDLGWADLGCYGSSFHETPEMDQLARDGMQFTSFYTAGSVCSPTRSSIMTGKYPPRTGVTDWIPGQKVNTTLLEQLRPSNQLALEEFTIGEAFKAAGYQTFYTGKWHLGGKGFLPTDQGFDDYVGDADDEEEGGGKGDAKARLLARRESTERFTKAMIDFMGRRDQAKPFFAMLSYHDVHTPIQAMPGMVEKYQDKARQLKGKTPLRKERNGQTQLRQDNPDYASMVAAVDQSLAAIRAALRALQLETNTILVFTSDNGGLSTRRQPGPTSNEPLRAGKGWLYEGGIRVPLLISWPNRIKPDTRSDVALISNDFYPTLLEAAGISLQPRQHVDGLSFATLLQGGPAPDRMTLYWHYPHYHGSTWAPGASMREGNWKLVEFFEDDSVELYDLDQDLGERNNLADVKPEKVRELKGRLAAWQKTVGAKFPRPRHSESD